jgi:hypothetical protein
MHRLVLDARNVPTGKEHSPMEKAIMLHKVIGNIIPSCNGMFTKAALANIPDEEGQSVILTFKKAIWFIIKYFPFVMTMSELVTKTTNKCKRIVSYFNDQTKSQATIDALHEEIEDTQWTVRDAKVIATIVEYVTLINQLDELPEAKKCASVILIGDNEAKFKVIGRVCKRKTPTAAPVVVEEEAASDGLSSSIGDHAGDDDDDEEEDNKEDVKKQKMVDE